MTTHSAFNPNISSNTPGAHIPADSTTASNGSLSQKPFRLFTESESSKFAGVSLDTIRQYERYGLLSPVKKGIDIFYKESELRTLFGITGKGGESVQESTTIEQAPQNQPSQAAERTQTEKSSTMDSTANFTSKPEQVVFESPQQGVFNSSSHQHRPLERHVGTPQPEISSGLYEMMEITRTLREQIQTLKEERDWLRTRVEKLETRGERDQMLIIAENETVKAVLAHKPEKRRSFWGLALPWIKE